MSEQEQKSPQKSTAESQQERWVKYGTNVVVTSIVVIALAVVVIWLAQKANKRLDTTTAGLYSLKPQTLNIIRDNQQKIKIISLYTSAKQKDPDAVESEKDKFDYITPVSDLLDEYKRKGKDIDVESIDPASQQMKVDQLIEEVADKYGGEISKYKEVIKDYPGIYAQIEKLAGDEKKLVEALPTVKALEGGQELAQTDRDWVQALNLTVGTVSTLPQFLTQTRSGIERILKQRIPDYKGATNAIDVGMTTLSQMIDEQLAKFDQVKDNAKFPKDVRDYIASSTPRFKELKKLADDLDKRVHDLGELKLDTLKQSLRQEDVILVMGDNDIRVLPKDKVWQAAPPQVQRASADEKIAPRFSGEQQITSAILALDAKSKPKVVFVRAGGPPLATSSNPFQAAPLSMFAERLEEYNFDVKEKDVTGMYAMQAQQQGMPPAPEPSDDEIKDAIWIVLDVPSRQGPAGGLDMALGQKLEKHLSDGGSALVLAERGAVGLGGSLDQWGIKVRTDAVAVHQPVPGGDSDSGDIVEQAQRSAPIFVLHNYGDHFLTRPVNSLDAVWVAGCVVQLDNKPGYVASTLLPIPEQLKVWGETNLDSLSDPKFDKDADIAAPINCGAAVEKTGAGRVVVIGSVLFATDQFIQFNDSHSRGVRFPGNGELLMNSIFWLAKMEPMIAISPAAMDVNRVRQIDSRVFNFWRVGVLLILLPGLVLVLGAAVYLHRRD